MKNYTKKQLLKKAWKLMSESIRQEGVDFAGYGDCYTCGVVKHWKEMHCGHYIHGKGDLDRRNLKRQCVKCNNYLSGNLGKYAERLVRDNGEDWLREMRREIEAKGNDYSKEELIKIIEDLKTNL